MKQLLLLFISLLLSLQGYPAEITIEHAKRVARNYLVNNNKFKTKNTTEIKLTDVGDILSRDGFNTKLKATTETNRNIYIFNIGENNGFIIIAGDDAAVPVLGYSSSGKINPDETPYNVKKWLEGYKQQVIYIQSNNLKATELIKAMWNGDLAQQKSANSSVSPLLSTQWDQAPYVNAQCPYDYSYGELTVTGCPATTMAQIMKYWNYPEKGIGFHSYQHVKYGTLSANFGNTSYNWAGMPNVVNSSNASVATLMYHCGVAVEMNYNVAAEGGSGSYVVKDPYERYSDNQTCENAYVQYFGYSPTIQGIFRADYSDAAWTNLIKNELDAGRPVQYAGYGQGGHTFVCDGYDANDYFHMNWGWGGYYDGYFLLDALNPGAGGIGSGAGTYNDGQQAVIGIKPAEEQEEGGNTTDEFGLTLYSNIIANKTTIGYGEGFVISTQISNGGTIDFTGDLCAAVFDESNTVVEFVQLYENVTLESGYYYDIDFISEGSTDMLPGDYSIYIFAKSGNSDWSIISEGYGGSSYIYTVQISVENNNNIALYSSMNILSDDVISGQPLEIQIEVGNWGASDFTGTVDINLFNLEGEFELVIDEVINTTIQSGYYNTYTFSTNSLNIEPGTYLLAVFHKPSSGDFELTGSTSGAPNPVKIIVQEAPYNEDMYENNDDINNSFALVPSYIDNISNITTVNSNIHVGSDWDFYSVDLEGGYDYNIDIRLHDSYSSGDGNSYSVDVLFLYSLDGIEWSETYDDVMSSSIITSGNRTLYCVVSPYFLGETGTYLLDINVDRSGSSANAEITEDIGISVYPNPAYDFIELSAETDLKEYFIYDINGKQLISGRFSTNQSIDVSTLLPGIYIIEASSGDKQYKGKILKR